MSSRFLLFAQLLRTALTARLDVVGDHAVSDCDDGACAVLVSFSHDQKFDFKFNEATSVADLRAGIAEYLLGQGAKPPFPTLNLVLWKRGRTSQALSTLTDDDAKLAQLGANGREVRPVQHGLLGGVMGGERANWKKYDFVCELYFNGQEKGFATGFVWGNVVLTAAHNFAGKSRGFEADLHIRTADLEWHSLGPAADSPGGRNIHIHPDYFKTASGQQLPVFGEKVDLAVAFLAGPGYRPKAKVQLATKMPAEGAKVKLAGFGLSETDAHSGGGPERPLNVAEFAYTGFSRRARYGNPALGSAMVTNSRSTADGCQGDSGGPWFVETSHMLGLLDPTFVVIGIHHGSSRCDPSRPTSRGDSDFTLLPVGAAEQFWHSQFQQVANWPLQQ